MTRLLFTNEKQEIRFDGDVFGFQYAHHRSEDYFAKNFESISKCTLMEKDKLSQDVTMVK